MWWALRGLSLIFQSLKLVKGTNDTGRVVPSQCNDGGLVQGWLVFVGIWHGVVIAFNWVKRGRHIPKGYPFPPWDEVVVSQCPVNPGKITLFTLILLKPFEQSAKTNFNVEQVFFSIARDIKQRIAESDSKAEVHISLLKFLVTLNGFIDFWPPLFLCSL